MMDDKNFEAPVFKILASNDTSSAPGHQGGIVIPKDLSDFFPDLVILPSPSQPTVDVEIIAELELNGLPLGKVIARYQLQTWGGTRSPERRLTSNLGAIRDVAQAGDILLFQKSITDPNLMKLNLVTNSNSAFSILKKSLGSKRWGILDEVPSRNSEVAKAESELLAILENPFELFASGVMRVMSSATRIARDRAFQKLVLKNFEFACSITGRELVAKSGAVGIDAAHIVPLAKRGTNDVRNGLSLSKELHWAFDCGLIGVENGKVAVSEFAKNDRRNEYIRSFEGAPLREIVNKSTRPDASALSWHFQNIFLS